MSEIVVKSFPELKYIKIEIDFNNVLEEDDAYFIYGTFSKNEFFIDLDKSLKIVKKEIIVGGIVHELCHIVWELNIPEFKSKDLKFYKIIPKYRQRDEKYTDLETILRGYGSELFSLMDYYQRYPTRGYKKGTYSGLTVDDLKKINFQGARK